MGDRIYVLYKSIELIAFIVTGEVFANGGGHSNTFRKQDDHGNYAFGYDITDAKGAANARKESGGHGHA
ncbi:adult-specific rigid cuticular protein 15.7-like protein, partial [Leptotrombidium deliense]